MSLPSPLPDELAASDRALAEVTTDHLLGGAAGATFDIEDPATRRVIAQLPDHRAEETLAEIERADRAGAAWARTSPRHRSDLLHRVYDHLIANRETLAYVITREMGKPLTESLAEVQYSADYVRWYAEELLRPGGSYRESLAGDATIITRRSPVGLAVLIAPWNFPMAMAARKIAPALAAGCATVTKPAALTPLTTVLVAKLFVEAGIPEDLVRVITTTSASTFSSTALRDPRVRKLSFTGSTGVGSTLLALASENIVKSSMELGGNAPLLVFDDADLERAIDGAILAKMRNGGQTCVAANRMYIQDGIADAFVEGFTERMSQISLGNPLAAGVELGPVIDQRAVDRLDHLVNDAVHRGATLTTGGGAPSDEGYFFEASVLDHVPADADVWKTEIFGPLAAITRFSTEEEAIAQANDTPFGLASFVFTESLDRALNVGEQMETGMVGINQGLLSNVAAPFGGVKQSGVGREGSSEGLEEYQEIQYLSLTRRPSR